MEFYELLILVFGCLSLLDLIRWKITELTNKNVVSILEVLGGYKTSFIVKQIIEKLLVVVCIIWIIWKLW